MSREYEVRRKLQEQSGSYFVILPKIWVESEGLKQGDLVCVKFNGILKLEPLKHASCGETGKSKEDSR